MTDKFPSWRYGPNGQSVIVNSEEETPKGWVDHPSKVKGAAPAPEGVKTARSPAVTAAEAAKSTGAKSQTHTDPAISAKSGVGGVGGPAAAPTPGEELDADGHPFDPTLHAATKSKTKGGLWRMKVGVARPAPAAGYPLDL